MALPPPNSAAMPTARQGVQVMRSGFDEYDNPVESHLWRGIRYALMIEAVVVAFVAGVVAGMWCMGL